jgi:CubicO group peptidase (beta-lactamase class C family)
MGWIVGEVVRRVSGRTIGRLFADEVAAPLGLDLWIGLPEEEEFRYAPFVEFDPRMRAQLRAWMSGDTLSARVLGSNRLYELDLRANSRRFHALGLPFANGIGTARSLARKYAATFGPVDGFRLLNDETIADAVPGRRDALLTPPDGRPWGSGGSASVLLSIPRHLP